MTTDNILKKVILMGIFIIPFIPFIVSSGLFFPFITGKAFAFRLIVGIITALWFVLILRKEEYRPRNSWLLIAFVLFTVVIFVADILGVNPGNSIWSRFERMEGFVLIAHLFLLFLVSSSMLRVQKDWNAFWHVTLGASIAMVGYGLFQIAGVAEIHQGGVRLDGSLGNATYLAIYMVFHAFFVLYYLLSAHARQIFQESKGYLATGVIVGTVYLLISFFSLGSVHTGKVFDLLKSSFSESPLLIIFSVIFIPLFIALIYGAEKWKGISSRLVYGIMLVAQMMMLYFTATRGAILGFIGGIVLTFLLLTILDSKRTTLRKVSGGIVIGVIVLSGLFFAVKDQSFISDNQVLGRFSDISLEETTTQSRFIIWNIAYEGFKERPLLGYGQGNFHYVFNDGYVSDLHRSEPYFDRAHNIVFDWLIAGGILGLIAYLLLFVASLILIWKKHSNDFSLVGKTIVTGLLAAYFFNNLFVFDNLVSYMMFGFVLAFIHSKDVQGLPSFVPQMSKKTITVLSTIGVLVITYGIVAVNYPAYAQNKVLINAISPQEEGPQKNLEFMRIAVASDALGQTEARHQFLQVAQAIVRSEAPQELKQSFVSGAVDAMLQQIEEDPNNILHKVQLGTFFATIGENKQSEALLREAIAMSPEKQQIRIILTEVLIQDNRPEEALANALEAYEINITNQGAWRSYAQTAARAGNSQLFDQLINGAMEDGRSGWVVSLIQAAIKQRPDNPQNYASLAATYVQIGEIDKAYEVLGRMKQQFPELSSQVDSIIEGIQAGNNVLEQ